MKGAPSWLEMVSHSSGKPAAGFPRACEVLALIFTSVGGISTSCLAKEHYATEPPKLFFLGGEHYAPPSSHARARKAGHSAPVM